MDATCRRHTRTLLAANLLLILLALLALLASCRAPVPYGGRRYAELLREDPPRSLPMPVDGVSPSRLVDSWGSAREGGRPHQGIDIFAPRGTPVRSTTEGVIEQKGMHGLGGQVVTVMGPGGYRHYYAHLEDFAAQEQGDWVRPGEQIGTVGNSGNAAVSPTHLHYGIYAPSGEAIDPYPLLAGRSGRRRSAG